MGTDGRRPDLMGGFRSLSLDPSPKLRESRRALAARRPAESAWNTVSRAMHQSIRAVDRTVGK